MAEEFPCCPFCGESEGLEFTDELTGMIQVMCMEYTALGPTANTHEEALAKWANCRARG